MQKQVGTIGAIRKELRGKACPYCGGRKYQLVLRCNCAPESAGIFARCSRCHTPKELDDDLRHILLM